MQRLNRGQLLWQGSPEGWDIHDGNALDRPKAQQVMVGRHQIVCLPGDCTFQELVVGRIPALPNRALRRDNMSPPSEKLYQGAGLNRGPVEFLEDFGSAQDILDLSQDGFGKKENESAVPPRVENLGREAVVLGDRSAQQDLRIKNDAQVWPHGGLRRSRLPQSGRGVPDSYCVRGPQA